VAWIYRDGRDSKIVIINAELSAITRDVETLGYSIASMDWMPNGRHMIVSYLDNSDPDHGFDLGILDTDTGSVKHALDLGQYDSEPMVSPDGLSVVFYSNPEDSSEIFLWTLPSDISAEDVW
jgi:Tol biopolymer transport system component